ncbi:aspartate kinase [Rickettsia conorii subsp. heilongjiangensis]|uniref:Aspartokinase n=1 Tax=Rickettsia conorii subsp. heilongjiangensis TaxID=226665 RepID=A0AAD1GJX7_RICCR|nr:aspartate kinase [Rickettsia conorii]AEK75138.1 aspartate kinase [Rickettsia conorii subsp. heilongjiangensis 054]BBM91867.1 aspartate kinase [Rickettsia conorii subsp. heilongjiangensis]BBM93076.1 aspartate kinase [Rickettsia conorii subsp. heilongjiangensis]BBM94285.1 aspartate kinase [Rickettsia conorii subsp. heilongjiangensis]BBM95494.1 aspartate kinase [Rickettsia conorii subsp. heilongjiangensis]
MALIIQKFGGTSVANIDRIKKIVPIIKTEIAKNNQVIVVVSAMAGVTNQLVTLCNEVSSLNNISQFAEYDVALSSGEIVTASLLALALQEEDIKARSFLAWQLPMLTDNNHSKALVESITTDLLEKYLQLNTVPIIAGFQGINKSNRLTTLGRGGSDTTAALIAAAMKADRCDIYTDVEGIFTTDPRIIPNAKKIKEIDFLEMLELASSGAKVLHPRAGELVMRYKIDMRVLSTFSPDTEGTLITSKDKNMENGIINSITSNKNLLKISVKSISLSFLQVANMITQNNNHIEFMQEIKNNEEYSFITNLTDKNNLQALLTNLKDDKQIQDFTFDTEIATISLIGYGIKNDCKLLETILSKLTNDNINVHMIQLSEIKITLFINDQDAEKTIFNLYNLLDSTSEI